MAAMSLLIAAHPKVETTVSSGVPGVLVRGVLAAVCVKANRPGRLYLYAVERGLSLQSRFSLNRPSSDLTQPFSKLECHPVCGGSKEERGEGGKSFPVPQLRGHGGCLGWP